MKCEVLLFAQIRDAVGRDRLEIELPVGAKVRDALDALASKHEAIAKTRSQLAVAVDERYANTETVLREGCTIALIPPVSGG